MSAPRPILAGDNDTPQRRRRQVAVPQAAIARAVRVASQAGPTWRVSIEGNVIQLFQTESPVAAATPDDPFARGLGIVP
jgi:hypothetical protein